MEQLEDTDYRSVFELAPDPVALIRDGRFFDCNQAMLDMFALKDKAELVGKRAGQAFSPEEQTDGEPSGAKAARYLQQCIDEGRASFTWTTRRSDGDLLSVWVLLHVLDQSDSPAIAVYLRDMSRLKASEQVALDRKMYLKELLESSPVAFLVCDLDTGFLLQANRKARQLLRLSDRFWADFRADDFLARPADRMKFLRRLRRQGEASGEVEMKRLDGSRFPAHVTWRYNPGRNSQLLCWGVDISDFKRTERELELSRNEAHRADNAKSEFLSRMSHELRTPMNAILGFGQLLEMNSANLSKEQNEAIQHILSGGEHLLELIKDILDFSRANSGHVNLRIRRVSTAIMLEDSLALVQPLADKAGVSVSLPTEPPTEVMADPRWLRQVMVNLLSNAIKYNHPDGTVRISSEARAGGKLRICVSDSGEGINESDWHRLFKPFERFSASRPEIEGTGIGLALCKQFVEFMGGSIGFDSEVGRGSDFWIELPVAEESSAAGKPLKILYIERQLANVESVVDAARSFPDCEIITSSDAGDAMALASSSVPDVIVMEAGLSVPEGAALIEELKGDDTTRGIPVVGLVSQPRGHWDDDLRSSFSHLLTQPLQAKDLVRLILTELD